MSRQITLRVSPQQLEAYETAAEHAGLEVGVWSRDILKSSVGKLAKLRAAPPFPIKNEETRDQKLCLWLSNQIETLVDTAANESRVSTTSWCTLVLDTAAGISRLAHYLKRVS